MTSFAKLKRKVDKVYLHCSASDAILHDNIQTIKKWHVDEKGWKDVGYHYVITKDGKVHTGRSLEDQPAAQYPYNKGSIAICLTGLRKFSDIQFEALKKLCNVIAKAYEYEITFHGHKEVDLARECPVYSYKEILGLDRHGYITKTEVFKKTKNKSIEKKVNIIDRIFSFFEDLF